MFKRENNFTFFAYFRLKVFLLPDRFAPALRQSGHSTMSLLKMPLMLNCCQVACKFCFVY